MLLRVAFLLCLLAAAPLRAHPEIEEALQRLNAQLAITPHDAALYLARGELYARHDDAVAAEANYLRAAELAPELPRLDLARGALACGLGHWAEARALLDRAVQRDPADPTARILRGRTLAQLGERAAAARDYDHALAQPTAVAPEIYLERAAVAPDLAAALRILDAGLERLGSVPALATRALELAEQAGDLLGALARLDQLARESERRETWLARRGDLLLRAGRPAEARAAYSAALAEIARLPHWLQSAPETAALAARLRNPSSIASQP